MELVYFLIAIFASSIGSVSGVGGGVIIKPLFDTLGIHTVQTVGFLSGCTVLVMSFVSLVRSRKSKVPIDLHITLFLALGSAAGGILGKLIFTVVYNFFNNGNLVGLIQSFFLFFIHVFVFLYVLNKEKIKSHTLKNPFFSFIIGIILGIISVFLGIGGGPINVAILYFFYSMKSKEAALNSLFMILCSQFSGLMQSALTATIPQFEMLTLAVMCLGGVSGGLLGSKISQSVSDIAVNKVFLSVLILLILLNAANIVLFFLRLF